MSGLPQGWVGTDLGSIADVNPKPSVIFDEARLVSFVPMAAVEEESGRVFPTATMPYGELRKKSYRQFEEGDVIVAKITPSMENGKAAVARGLVGERAFGSTEFHVLRPLGGISPSYLLHFILQRSFRGDAARRMTGTAGQLRVPVGYLKQAPIPLPPLPEQHRIIAAIEEQFSRLDAGVASLQRAKRNLARMRASVLSAAVEGRLIAQDPGDKPVSLLHPLTPSPTELPPNWTWANLADITTGIRNGTFVSRPDLDASGVPIFRISAVRPMRLDIGDVRYAHGVDAETVSKFRVNEGDLLFTRYSGQPEYVGACALVPSLGSPVLHPDKLIRATPDCTTVVPRFLEAAVSSGISLGFIRSVRKTTAGQTGIAGSDLKRLPVPIPPLREQHRIIAEMDRQFSILDSMEAAVDGGLARAERLRQSILREAFAGRLVSQDPAEEPASALLERIQLERTKK